MSTQMTSSKTIVQRIFTDLWNQGDLAAADDIFARPDGVKRYVGEFRQAFPDIQHQVEAVLAEGDTVIVRWLAKGTHRGQWHSLAPTNQPIEYRGVTTARLAGGKIVEHETLWDTLTVLEQLSAVPLIRKTDGGRL